MNAPHDIVSIGRAANHLGVVVPVVRSVADELQIPAVMTIDGVPFFERDAIPAIAQRIAETGASELARRVRNLH